MAARPLTSTRTSAQLKLTMNNCLFVLGAHGGMLCVAPGRLRHPAQVKHSLQCGPVRGLILFSKTHFMLSNERNAACRKIISNV